MAEDVACRCGGHRHRRTFSGGRKLGYSTGRVDYRIYARRPSNANCDWPAPGRSRVSCMCQACTSKALVKCCGVLHADSMLMLAQPSVNSASVSVVLSGGGSFGSTLADRIATAPIPAEVRSSPVLENWEGLKDVSTRWGQCGVLV